MTISPTPQLPGMFTTFKAKDTPLFVEGSAFHDPWHYGKIMGYDKWEFYIFVWILIGQAAMITPTAGQST